jgi:Uncharacterised nucleotidyltransferase
VNTVDSIPEATNRAEEELLLCCVRPDVDSETHDRIRALVTGQIDWECLFFLARRHAVLPLLYVQLHQTAADVVPHEQLERLQKTFQENSARNVVLTAELARLMNLLGNAGIEVIPYKGPVLALFAYGNVAVRRFVDLDIMVRKEDVPRAIDLLLADGYEVSKSLNVHQRQVLLRTQHNLQFQRAKRQLIVELHWEVASHFFASSVQAEDLWGNLVDIELNEATVKTLRAEDLIFSLCVHGSRHLWERLLWICDLAWIVAGQELNWRALLERAKATNTERMFLLGLHLSSNLLKVSLPNSIVKRIDSDPELEKLSIVIKEGLFTGTEHKPATFIQILRFNLMVRESWASRVRYFRHITAPTERDVDAIALPKHLSFGYYLMRPFRLLFKI